MNSGHVLSWYESGHPHSWPHVKVPRAHILPSTGRLTPHPGIQGPHGLAPTPNLLFHPHLSLSLGTCLDLTSLPCLPFRERALHFIPHVFAHTVPSVEFLPLLSPFPYSLHHFQGFQQILSLCSQSTKPVSAYCIFMCTCISISCLHVCLPQETANSLRRGLTGSIGPCSQNGTR